MTASDPGAVVVEASAPVRICDIGGWTDTWFGGPGRVLNVAVAPGATVAIREVASRDPVSLVVETTGDRYAVTPGSARVARHPLLEVAIDSLPPPEDRPVEIRVGSGVPPGCGAGTSAAVAVALLGALTALRSERSTPHAIASAAHRLEVEVLGIESGIQDQLSAAYGGINYIEIDAYPEATVQRQPPWDELGSVLSLVYLGRAHTSSAVHEQVIEQVRHRGSPIFERLRDAAVAARVAVQARDLHAFAAAAVANTDAQRALHPDVVGVDAERVIELAAAHGAIGWKVNGAGGDGGSVTLISPTAAVRLALERRIASLDPRYRVLPTRLSAAGLEVHTTAAPR